MGINAINYVQLSPKLFMNCIGVVNRQNQLFSEMSLRDVMELHLVNYSKYVGCVDEKRV